MLIKKGTVVKVSGEKTIKVEVLDYRSHPKYKKQYRVTRRFLVHDESNSHEIGDTVSIIQTRPVSKRKHWKVAA